MKSSVTQLDEPCFCFLLCCGCKKLLPFGLIVGTCSVDCVNNSRFCLNNRSFLQSFSELHFVECSATAFLNRETHSV